MMYLILGIGICVVAIIVMVTVRKYLIKQLGKVSEDIRRFQPYSDNSCDSNSNTTNGIPLDLSNVFCNRIISTSQKSAFTEYHAPLFLRASQLVNRLKLFKIEPTSTILDFIYHYQRIDRYVALHNNVVIEETLTTNKDFFDSCLSYPLDQQQRRSIISEEDNCLVVSSAGSGKTSSIVGKVKYLTEIKGIKPERILLISYTNKAATELTERMATAGLKGYTFHKLALDIIGQTTGEKPSICDNTDALFVEIYHRLLECKSFKRSIVEYFADYQNTETAEERDKRDKLAKLSDQKRTQLKAMLPDMDGRTITVRSEQEQKICFALSSLGVKFRYEEPYEHKVADEMHSQYRPDFSIYYESKGKTKRIYLEHFGIDEHGLVPSWFAKDRNITYEEANKRYNDGITWKIAAHEKFGTQLLVTSSADFQFFEIKDKLKNLLVDAGVPIDEKSDEELYDLVLPKGSNREKAFIRLVVTFVTLVKSSCKPVNEILNHVQANNDKRSKFIIKNIFIPVYERYAETLKNSEQIDFTDAILQATEICRKSRRVEYDYIIVDEFQDISVDRYNFLKVLREGNPPAKLYCVGDDWQSIYRFSGSDMALFNQFADYFGATEINKIETTYRFGEPIVGLSSYFIQRNNAQIKKNIRPFSYKNKTELLFCKYNKDNYCTTIKQIINSIPTDKSVFLLGRYSFDDYYLSSSFESKKEGNRFYYIIDGRKIEFLTVHKSKGLEADYVILLQCNKDTYGFPSLVSDDPVLNYVLTQSDQFPYGEERRLFYVAITRAKNRTFVLYDERNPSVFVDEFLHPESITEQSYEKHPNANKIWTEHDEKLLLQLYREQKSVKYIAEKLGRSQTSIVMRLNKLLR